MFLWRTEENYPSIIIKYLLICSLFKPYAGKEIDNSNSGDEKGSLHKGSKSMVKDNMSLNTRKPIFGLCDQVILKPACSATEESWNCKYRN